MLSEAFRKSDEAGYWRARIKLVEEHARGGSVFNYDECRFRIASFYAHLGELDSAVPFLREALEQREIALVYVRTVPEFQPFRSDARIVDIMRQMGFPAD